MMPLQFVGFLQRTLSQIATLRKLSGKASATLFIVSTAVGSTMAIVEFSFAFYLQHFFAVLGMVSPPNKLTDFLPVGITSSALVLLLIGFLRLICQALKIYCSRLAQQHFSNNQRAIIIEKYLKNPQVSSSAEAISLFNDEIQRGSLAFMNLSFFLIALSSALVLFFSMLTTETSAAILSLGFCALLYFPSKLINRLAGFEGKELSRHWGNLNSFFVDGIRNNFYLRIYNQVDSTIASAKTHLELYLHSYKKTFAILSIKSTYPAYVGLVLVCLVGITQYKLGSSNAGSLLIFFYLFLRFSQEAASAIGSLSEFTLHTNSLRAILAWSRRASEFEKASETTSGLTSQPSLQLPQIDFLECLDISFNYPGGAAILQNLSLRLSRGDCLAIMGPSGSGKSTLLALLLGLEKPVRGEVRINGQHPLQQVKIDFLKNVGYVGPIPFLIAGTLKDNLLYAHPNPESVTESAMEDCLKTVYLYDHIIALPRKLQTPMDEAGNVFSSGQKQRLMLARALLRLPQVLVLDEATANLDTDLESKILRGLKESFNTKILIAVSHREAIKTIQTQLIEL